MTLFSFFSFAFFFVSRFVANVSFAVSSVLWVCDLEGIREAMRLSHAGRLTHKEWTNIREGDLSGRKNLRIVNRIPKTPLFFPLVLLVLLNVFYRLVVASRDLLYF